MSSSKENTAIEAAKRNNNANNANKTEEEKRHGNLFSRFC